MSRPFAVGDSALVLDRKGRRYLLTLAEDGTFHTHAGFVPHAAFLGEAEGVVARSTAGAWYQAVRPTLSDFVLKMPRGAQVIYPKDLGQILVLADVFPGARVLEAGVGSGALSLALLRAGARISGYEVRPDFAAAAVANVGRFLGREALASYEVRQRDVYDGIEERGLDRVVLDLPEPWRVVVHAAGALSRGGLFVAYLPSIVQVSQLRSALDDSPFAMAETVEVLLRTWHVEGAAVRPDHRMVAHTGFLTAARLLGSGPGVADTGP
ncbi:MAG TPA: tRNA (adenine-N1)-methyltransferase [Acidimicrobiales bacterium]|nr:tRNA (adenine-N1)-methyltransferase [Acidimicrobiales bacterium]